MNCLSHLWEFASGSPHSWIGAVRFNFCIFTWYHVNVRGYAFKKEGGYRKKPGKSKAYF
jgi:hypothetical protein